MYNGGDFEVSVTKTFRFAYAHRLYNDKLTETENELAFGKCGNPHYHGHNSRVLITVTDDINPLTGMVINFKKLKEICGKIIDEQFDHRNLNEEVDELKDIPTTCENTAVVLWNKLYPLLPNLSEITMYEEDDSSCTIRRRR